jgi:hypothetical protein
MCGILAGIRGTLTAPQLAMESHRFWRKKHNALHASNATERESRCSPSGAATVIVHLHRIVKVLH